MATMNVYTKHGTYCIDALNVKITYKFYGNPDEIFVTPTFENKEFSNSYLDNLLNEMIYLEIADGNSRVESRIVVTKSKLVGKYILDGCLVLDVTEVIQITSGGLE